MISKTLDDIQKMVQGSGLQKKDAHIIATGVAIDSRQVTAGNLYIPIIGAKVDGHTFAYAAAGGGACACLWQQDIPNPPANIPLIVVDDTTKALARLATAYKEEIGMRIVGITGSNGKTSTKDILASILAQSYHVHKTPGNLNSEYGLPLTLLMAPATTDIAVLEMGMRGRGQIQLLSDMVKPEVAIITCIGEAHIEQLGTRENISIAKFEITSGLRDDGLFIYHGDEPLLHARLAEAALPFTTCSFGEKPTNDYALTSLSINGDGMDFTCSQYETTFHLPVLGKHNVLNALSAIATASYFGIDSSNIKKGLSDVKMSAMRMAMRRAKNGMTLIDDCYNSSPTSVYATLDLLRSLTAYDKKIVVLADMLELGENEVAYHREIGQSLASYGIDIVLTYGELSKHTAEASGIIDTRHFTDKFALATALLDCATDKDVVLAKGSRGMALEDVINAVT